MTPDADQPKATKPEPVAAAAPKDSPPSAQPDASTQSNPEAKPGAKSAAKPAPQDDYKTLPLAEVEKKLGSSPDGLTDAEAKKRLAQYGPNELVVQQTNLLNWLNAA